MRGTLTAVAMGAVLMIAGPSAAAGGPGKAAREALFDKLDKNGDGNLSLEEFMAMPGKAKPKKLEAMFKKLDRNEDGQVSKDEFTSHENDKKKSSDKTTKKIK